MHPKSFVSNFWGAVQSAGIFYYVSIASLKILLAKPLPALKPMKALRSPCPALAGRPATQAG